MRKIVTLLAGLLCAVALWAQETPEQILNKLDAWMDRAETEGLSMTMDMKIPILGTFSTRVSELGQKTRLEMEAKGITIIDWEDGKTSWSYKSKNNEITIKNEKPDASSDADDGLSMMDGITDGYDVVLEKETADVWYFLCKKQKTNKDKDAPKKMNVSVKKGTYALDRFQASMSGVTITIYDMSIGVKEEDVTFDISRYPNAKIVDERNK